MNRKHTAKEYLEIIDKLKKNNDDLEFTSDFIISYPGESENDFINTCDLMKKLNSLILTHLSTAQDLEHLLVNLK